MRPFRAAVLITATLGAVLAATSAHAQTDWNALRTLPREADVEIQELGGKRRTGGKLVLVEDDQLTIIRRRRPVVIPKALVGRIDHRKKDPVWNGLLIGIIWGILARATYAAEACFETPDPKCTLQAIAVTSAMSTFIDWNIRGKDTIYRAPKRRAIPIASIRF